MFIEDDPHDAELIMTALAENNPAREVVVMQDGEETLDYRYGSGKFESRAACMAVRTVLFGEGPL
ncbi:MAG: hypothetical protein ABSA46_15495 [Thermodesulfovibrionales bacterium]